jgi:DNA polymerase-3 subunit delta'
MADNLFPWHESSWERLTARAGALPHAILLRGRSGLGKTDLAVRFAQWLLCEADPRPVAGGCGRCPACNWFGQGHHPDFRRVQPEALAESPPATETEAAGEVTPGTRSGAKPSRQIKIDQIRALADFLAVGTHRAGVRVALIRPAEAMNASTANALLKALEEPPPRTLFLLVSSQPSRLLATLRSRCQAVDVAAPTPAEAVAWLRAQGVTAPEAALAYTGHAPLAAADQSRYSEVREALVRGFSSNIDALTAVDRWQQFEGADMVDALQKWVHDAVQLRVGGHVRYFTGHEAQVAASLRNASAVALTGLARRLARARSEVLHPLNPRLFLEALALEITRLNEVAHVR